jgi:hypothetical protein
MWHKTELPDFSWYMIPKQEKNVTNGHNISQMSVKYYKWPLNVSTFSNLRPYNIYPNWYFRFENKPSGNPGTKDDFIVSKIGLNARQRHWISPFRYCQTQRINVGAKTEMSRGPMLQNEL